MNSNLRITGPSPLPPAVLLAINKQMISHRSKEFSDIVFSISENLKLVFGTREVPLLFTASGTGGLECAVINVLKPHSKVLSIETGFFGRRFTEIATAFGMDVSRYIIEEGKAANPEELRKVLRKNNNIEAILLTHNETSTGILNPLKELLEVIHSTTNALILVDAVSSAGSTELEMDKWGIDVIISASQKALMAPPGLAILFASLKAMKIAEKNATPRYYFDFKKMQTSMLKGSTTYTPAVTAVYGLEAALKLMIQEGLPQVYERHRNLSKLCHEGLESIGVELFYDKKFASPTVTVAKISKKSATEVKKELANKFKIYVSQGREEHLKESTLRIGHMGYVKANEIKQVIDCFKYVLYDS